MESSFNQLRFDISEKVRLHPQQAGIGTLLELDLYPDVEIKDEGQHLRIQGYLRLNGTYLTKQEDSAYDELVHTDTDVYGIQRQELAYVIPVEITLPAERVEMAQISTEVETFDYQVLSPFELNIEAILMIDGLLPDQQEEWGSQEAEKDPAYDYPVFSGSPAQSLSIYSEEQPEKKQTTEKKEQVVEHPEELATPVKPNHPIIEEMKDLKVIDHPTQVPGDVEKEDMVPKQLAQEQSAQVNPAHRESKQQESKRSPASPLTQADEGAHLENQEIPQDKKVETEKEAPQEIHDSKEVNHEQNVALQPEKKDTVKKVEPVPKVILPKKETVKSEESSRVQPVHQLHEVKEEEKTIEKNNETTDSGEQYESTQGKQIPQAEEQNEEETNPSQHWIQWLVKNREEAFTPMRMVIVQKDESLEEIAEKYEVATGYLLRVNELQSDQLVEGQMLYIPKKQSQL